ncbi:MAG: hypothetical protein CM15mP126_3370 [Gammaproteobacteria bacterium]|nr:MAG: hypothetical protein CM15mP126_3370 [Gammaproteobacteria bacterium]
MGLDIKMQTLNSYELSKNLGPSQQIKGRVGRSSKQTFVIS